MPDNTFESSPGAYGLPVTRTERQRVLERLRRTGGKARLRDLAWRMALPIAEIERIAAALTDFDQVYVETIRPPRGRPSRWLIAL